MIRSEKKLVKVAILDLYEGQANEGMRCIRQLVNDYSLQHDIELKIEEFDVRLELQLPPLDHDIYISSGGPGSPLESEGFLWEKKYFNWLSSVEQYNNDEGNIEKKHVLFICHSFQLACRYFKIAKVTKRRSTAFGVFPVHVLQEGKEEKMFNGLQDPFFAVDSRDYQVVQPNHNKLSKMGSTILAIEKDRPHIPLERAIMAIRFNDYMVGTQFHPEADAIGMSMYLQRMDKKETVINSHGYEKWQSMIEQLNDPDKILFTYSHIIPNFLDQAIGNS